VVARYEKLADDVLEELTTLARECNDSNNSGNVNNTQNIIWFGQENLQFKKARQSSPAPFHKPQYLYLIL
jgi:hypothetical protein